MLGQEKGVKAHVFGKLGLGEDFVIQTRQVLPIGRILEGEYESEFHSCPTSSAF
jgi:hypothetical protein